jgi:D-alanyl-D-alanine carboxypeptidase
MKTITKIWRTTDKFLRTGSGYSLEGIIGAKTGYTSQSGFNLVTISSHGGHKYISVMLKSGNLERFRDTISLMKKVYQVRQVNKDTKAKVPL